MLRSDKFLWLVILALGIAVLLLIARHDEGTVGPLDSSSFASLVYFVALLLLIGGGMYSIFYGRFQETLKSVAIWGGIVALLVIAYNFRGDINRAVDRLFSVVTPDSDITASINTAAYITGSQDGEFLVRTQINGAPLTLLIDTGASSVVLTVEAARAAGLPVDLLKYDVTIATAKGRGFAAAVVLDQIKIGNIVERRVPALVAQPGQLNTSLLGMSFLSRLDSFEVRGKQMVLRGRR
jgi:aspartyl protease family protein